MWRALDRLDGLWLQHALCETTPTSTLLTPRTVSGGRYRVIRPSITTDPWSPCTILRPAGTFLCCIVSGNYRPNRSTVSLQCVCRSRCCVSTGNSPTVCNTALITSHPTPVCHATVYTRWCSDHLMVPDVAVKSRPQIRRQFPPSIGLPELTNGHNDHIGLSKIPTVLS